jgi:hypothetical protein
MSGETRTVYKILTRNIKGRDHLENKGVGGRIILKLFLEAQAVHM